MMAVLRTSIVSLVVFTVILGIIYPLAMTGIAQAVFPDKANGSIIVKNGKTVGSSLIGQPFSTPGYFWSRPSATTPYPYNAASSSGSNLGQNNPDLQKALADRISALKAADPENTKPIPMDLITSSGSGLDPHISPAAALYQIHRVAKYRGLSESIVASLVEKHSEPRQFGIFGDPVINVVKLNMALDELNTR
ncbi:MAG: potassium-transporting ATPase subunit KdpC [Nitrospirae bacterium]|nr:potassium-transporting ATPase subunit KdpC [Nitrospirota bacterium]MBF0533673.1 potassium-transporting ATPase subunit KdpC [Nitrospirota bacterium]MBF0616676.1 potassium-transporting ATPase subunit KdpC [Nitrospirota bacterium]